MKLSLILLFLTFCVQFTDAKIGYVKYSEIALLCLFFILFKLKNRTFLYLILFLAFIITTTFINNYFFIDFEHISNSLLKQPYFITLGRGLEFVSCIIFALITYNYIVKSKNSDIRNIIKKFLSYNNILLLFFVLIFCLVYTGIVPVGDSHFVYGYPSNYRLRGGFVEGGPFGLFVGFLFMLTTFLGPRRMYYRIGYFIVIIFMAKSKAGFSFVLLWLIIENISYLYRKIRSFLIPFLILSSIIFFMAFQKVAKGYIENYMNIEKILVDHRDDGNFILGRISGMHIVPNAISSYPMFGIGFGNYPLVRNNHNIREFFPLPPPHSRFRDAHGFGGLIDLLVETGILGISIFILIILNVYFKGDSSSKKVILAFFSVFLFGVQLIFIYPWMLLGIALAINEKRKTNLDLK